VVITAAAVAAGSALGLGLFLLVWQALPGTPSARRALRRLHPEGLDMVSFRATSARPGWLRALWRPPLRDLRLLRRTPQPYPVTAGASALVGLAWPALLAARGTAAGMRIPLAIPVLLSLATAAGFGWLARRDVVARAAKARYEFRRAV